MTEEEHALLINVALVARGCALVLSKMAYLDRDIDAHEQLKRIMDMVTSCLEPFRADAPQTPECEEER